MYPKIEIKVDSIVENINKIRKMDNCNRNITLVTKILAGEPELVKIICEKAQVKDIADSHIINLAKYKDIPARKWLINEPGLSEVSEVVKYSDISFNSELSVLKALNEEAKKQSINMASNEQNQLTNNMKNQHRNALKDGIEKNEKGIVIKKISI